MSTGTMTKYYHATQNGPVPFSPDQEAERDAEIAAWTAGEQDRKASAIRAERARRLELTDWRALADVVLSEAWAAYRQALRDVPAQQGFPDSVIWPEVPTDAA